MHAISCNFFFTWIMFYSVSFFHDTCDFPEIFACPDFCFSSWHSVSEHAWVAPEHESSSERRRTMHVYHGSNSCTHATMHHAGFKIPCITQVAPTSLPNPSRSQGYPKTHPSQQHCQGEPWANKSKKAERHEPIDSATLKTMDTKQTNDVKQQALFMKKKVAPLSYLMESMKINGTLSMPIMQADVFFT